MNKLGEHLGIKDVYGRPIKVGDSVDSVEFYRGNTYLSRRVVLGLTKGGNVRTGYLTNHEGKRRMHVSWTPKSKLMLSPQADAMRFNNGTSSVPDEHDDLRNQYNRVNEEDRSDFLKTVEGVSEYVDLT